jgi:hypothetical protein
MNHPVTSRFIPFQRFHRFSVSPVSPVSPVSRVSPFQTPISLKRNETTEAKHEAAGKAYPRDADEGKTCTLRQIMKPRTHQGKSLNPIATRM